MHIAVNAQLVSPEPGYRQAGVSRYIDQLLRELWKLPGQHRWTVYAPPGTTHARIGAPPSVTLRTSGLPTTNPLARIVWEQLIAPPLLLRDRPDVLLCPLNVMPLLAPCPTVVTVHDLAFLRFDLHRPAKRAYLSLLTRLSTRRAVHVITVSDFTRREVLELLPVPPGKVTAIQNGLDDRFRPVPEAEVAAFRMRHALPERFLLFVGTLEPRKNITTLLRAYAVARDSLRMPLLIGGGKGWRFQDIFTLAQELGVSEDVRFLGFVEQVDLPGYYAAATAVVYPALYEGFGFPPLEAMATGTPVVTSDAGALVEVVGDAGIQTPALDVAALAAALVRVTQGAELRRDLRARGLERAKRFSWARAAEETFAVLERAGR